MNLGVNVPNFGPGTNPQSLDRWAKTIDDLGFDLLVLSDHVAVTDDVAAKYPTPFFDPLVTIAWLAGRVSRVNFGTSVLVVPYRHPALLAQVALNLQELSGSRIVLGVGVGWSSQEFAALGLLYRQRGSVTDDYLAALRSLFSNDVASHNGPHIHFEGVHSSRTSTKLDAPQIWVGGNGHAALARAIKFGEAWHPLDLSLSEMKDAISYLEVLATSMEVSAPSFAPRIKLRITDRPLLEETRRVGTGTMEQLSHDLVELRNLKATTVVFDPYFGDPAETLHPDAMLRDLATVMDIASKIKDDAP